jgi:hypothetical protein
MRIITILILALMLSLTSIQVHAFQETEWYWIYHGSGCVPLSEMYIEFPYFTGARTPQDMLEKVRTATSGEDIHPGFSPILPIRAELKPFTEIVAKTPSVYQIYKDPRITRGNAVVLVVREEPQDFALLFFRGDLCNALFSSGPK